MNNNKNKPRSFIASLIALIAVAACSATQPMVSERLDDKTAVTITNARTPLIMSLDRYFSDANAREYVQIGAIEINRMGAREHFLWLGIWDIDHLESEAAKPRGYDTIHLIADGQTIPLDVHGWTHDSIGASSSSYKKIFAEVIDAYYKISLEQLEAFKSAVVVKLQTTSATPKEFIYWYNQERASADLAEFYRVVSQ
ncbi:MAG: hypothetical protein HOI35_12060 [Woeseia sp.]|jgi:hypothetical protein|nr:hypothetical protein [Woeseia sp.]MBT6210741.1 hypothetical protein [Woeseia sp.]